MGKAILLSWIRGLACGKDHLRLAKRSVNSACVCTVFSRCCCLNAEKEAEVAESPFIRLVLLDLEEILEGVSVSNCELYLQEYLGVQDRSACEIK